MVLYLSRREATTTSSSRAGNERAERVAKEMGFPANSYTVIKCELGSFKSVRDFVFNLRAFKGPRGLDALVCNAAVYLPVRAAAASVILNVAP